MLEFLIGFIWGGMITHHYFNITTSFYKKPLYYFFLFYPLATEAIRHNVG